MSDWKDRATKVDSTNDWKSRAQPVQPSDEADTNLLNTGVAQVAAGATGGFDDELAGGLSAIGRVAGIKGLGGKIKDLGFEDDGPTLDTDKIKQAYRNTRDQIRDMKDAQQEAHPVISTVANVGGMLANPIMGGEAGLAKLATLGAAQGLGDSKADNLTDMAKDTAIGGAIGGATGVAVKGAGAGLKYLGGKIGQAYDAALPKLGKAFASVDEDVTQRYLQNPESIRGAKSIEDLAQNALSPEGPIQKLKDHVSELSGSAWDTLSSKPQFTKEEVLSGAQTLIDDITKGKNSNFNRTGAVGGGADKISAIQNQLTQISEKYGDELSQQDLKSIIQDLQKKAFSMEGNPRYTEQAQGLSSLSGVYNDALKHFNPAYKEAMIPVQEATSKLQDMQKTFINKQDPDAYDKALNAIKSYGRKSEISTGNKAVDYIDNKLGTGFGNDIQSTLDKAQFDKTDINGSRKVQLGNVVGQGIGGALGGVGGFVVGGFPGAAAGFYGGAKIGGAIGSGVGAFSDKYAGNAFQSLLDGRISQMEPEVAKQLGPYAQVISDAVSRGPQALASTHFILQQTDSNYRDRINQMNGKN